MPIMLATYGTDKLIETKRYVSARSLLSKTACSEMSNMEIIFDSNCIDYENFCVAHKPDTLEAGRMELCKSFFGKSVLNESSCLHYLLPPPRLDAS